MARVSLFTSPTSEFTYTKEYKYLEETQVDTRNAEKENKDESEKCVFALLEFESPVTGRNSSLIIASRLDADIHQNACRLAFHGHILSLSLLRTTTLPRCVFSNSKKSRYVPLNRKTEFSARLEKYDHCRNELPKTLNPTILESEKEMSSGGDEITKLNKKGEAQISNEFTIEE